MARSTRWFGATLLSLGLMMGPLGCGDEDGTDVTISVVDPADEYLGTDLLFITSGDAADGGLICPVGSARVVTSLSEPPAGEIEWEFDCTDRSGRFVIVQGEPGVYGPSGAAVLAEEDANEQLASRGVTFETAETWEVLSGTDRYESLAGEGTSTWVVGPVEGFVGVHLVTTFVGTVGPD